MTVYGEEAIVPGLQSFALGHYEHKQTAQGTAPTLTSEYIYLPTPTGPMPIAAEINGRLYAVHTDQLNTPRQLTDENGNKVWQWGISGFGELEPTTAQTGWVRERNGSAGQISNTLPVTFNLRFPGQQFDEETGLHYNHHRYYDPYLTVGYTEADPLGLNAGWNRFVYVDGDAFSFSDPTGLIKAICKATSTGGVGYDKRGNKICEYECKLDGKTITVKGGCRTVGKEKICYGVPILGTTSNRTGDTYANQGEPEDFPVNTNNIAQRYLSYDPQFFNAINEGFK